MCDGPHGLDWKKSGITLSLSRYFFLGSVCVCVWAIESNVRAIAIYPSLSFCWTEIKASAAANRWWDMWRTICLKATISHRKDNKPRNESEEKKSRDSIQASVVVDRHTRLLATQNRRCQSNGSNLIDRIYWSNVKSNYVSTFTCHFQLIR